MLGSNYGATNNSTNIPSTIRACIVFFIYYNCMAVYSITPNSSFPPDMVVLSARNVVYHVCGGRGCNLS